MNNGINVNDSRATRSPCLNRFNEAGPRNRRTKEEHNGEREYHCDVGSGVLLIGPLADGRYGIGNGQINTIHRHAETTHSQQDTDGDQCNEDTILRGRRPLLGSQETPRFPS